jgi:hypothetical protein
LRDTLKAWWEARSTRERVHVVALVLLSGLAVAHQAWLWHWYVEDAAISFTYSRNLAEGNGLVTWVGGERVEGYSNPTWVFLLSLIRLVGLDIFVGAKWVQAALCAVTVPMTYMAAREAQRSPGSDMPLLAAAMLAGNAQFAIWGACGLENSLFCCLMATGLWRTGVELRAGGRPWSALIWFLVAISRPEALMYAGIAGFFSMVFHLRAGRGFVPTVQWLALFWLPFVAYQGARFAYFAYELPNTFYAKIGDHREPNPLNYKGHGWNYVRNWALTMGQGLMIPLYLLAMTGPGGRKSTAALAVATTLGVATLLPTNQRLLLPVVLGFTFICYQALLKTQNAPPRRWATVAGLGLTLAFIGFAEWQRRQGAESTLPSPEWLPGITSWMFAAVALAWPWMDWKQPGSRLRTICWATMCGGLLFAISVHGDWMKGWRWISLVTVPMSILLASGIHAAAQLVEEHWNGVVRFGPIHQLAAATLVIAPLPAHISFTQAFVEKPVTGPNSVRARVNYKTRIKARLHHYGPVIDLDVDQGAHMWWSGHRMLDIAGLVDVPMGQNKFEPTFIKQYIFEEQRPMFAHLHAGWATTSGIPKLPEWRRDYVELPGYPAGQQYHIGNFLRRELMLEAAWSGPAATPFAFGEHLSLAGWWVPSPEVAPDRKMYLELGVSSSKKLTRLDRVRALAFLSDNTGSHVATWDVPLGYDWVPPDQWRVAEVFHGRFSPIIPANLPHGTYDLGIILLDGNGAVLPAMPEYNPDDPSRSPLPAGVVLGGVGPWPARVARGELRFEGAVKVVSVTDMEAASIQDLHAAFAHSKEGRCGAAVQSWFLARQHRPRATDWFEVVGPEIDTAIAGCWANRAETEPAKAVTHLRRARDWDVGHPDIDRVGTPVAAALIETGDQALADARWGEAYAAYRDALSIEPHRAWVRRRAEQTRALSLGFDPKAQEDKQAKLETQRAAAAERRAAREAKRKAQEAKP